MIVTPRLLNNNTVLLPGTLFSNLQLDKILSELAISVLRQPCEHGEIVRRNELFILLDKDENVEHIEKTLSVLSHAERALRLLNDAKTPLDKYYRQAEVLESYVTSCEALASIHDMGTLFADVANYFSSDEKQTRVSEMNESVKKIKCLLHEMSAGLLSFSDKNWLTPDCNAVSEFDNISACAESLGFVIPKKKLQDTQINLPLSDAICRLYSDKVSMIEAEIAKYVDIDFYEPTMYIAEIKFYLEIHSLIQKANNFGVPHSISRIADTPR